MRILIVDDEEKIHEVIREYAQFNYYETDEAENGMQAVDKCSKNKYDLIIMDIMMPKLDGFTAVKKSDRTVMSQSSCFRLLVRNMTNCLALSLESTIMW